MEFKIKCEDKAISELVSRCKDMRKKISDSVLKLSEIVSESDERDNISIDSNKDIDVK